MSAGITLSGVKPAEVVRTDASTHVVIEEHGCAARLTVVLWHDESPAEWLRTSAARMLAVADELEPLVPVVTDGCAS